jgi:hypothetical protein
MAMEHCSWPTCARMEGHEQVASSYEQEVVLADSFI